MPLASDALAIARAGIRAVDPERAVRANLWLRGDRLTVGGRRIGLSVGERVAVVAIGKAASRMATAAAGALRSRRGDTIVVDRSGDPKPRISAQVLQGDHPVPRSESFSAGTAMLEFVRRRPPNALTLFLLSGGGSALLEAPAPGLAPHSVSLVTELLLESGAPIQEMNIVRRHLSRLKGGGLVAAMDRPRTATLAVSDVVGDTPWDIASGPTVPDPSTFREALDALGRWKLARVVPTDVRSHLERGSRGEIPETPKPHDPRWAGSTFHLIASNRTARVGAAREARRRGYRATLVDGALTGDTQSVAVGQGCRLVALARRRSTKTGALAVVSGGETTVTLRPKSGKGGRNQEFALTVARAIEGVPDVVFLSIGTDGIDGPTDAAGARVDGSTWTRLRRFEPDPESVLADHRTYPALDRLGALLRTGPTGTNVTDLHVGLVGRVTHGRAGSSPIRGARASPRRST